jgi:cytoskeletal protein RodZ
MIVRRDQGKGHPSDDDERTVEALPDEPTISAQIDVRAAFAAHERPLPGGIEDRTLPLPTTDEDDAVTSVNPVFEGTQPDLTLPGVVAQLLASAEPPGRERENTLPIVPASEVQRARALIAAEEKAAAMPSTPAVDDTPYEVPGVGAQRKKMLRIVLGVLSVCGLLCVGALVRQLWPEPRPQDIKSASSAATQPAQVSAAASTTEPSVAATAASATAVAISEPPPASAAPPASALASVASATAAPPSTTAAPLGAPVTATPVVAPAATPTPAATAPRPVVVHQRPGPSGTKPTSRGTIVRDSPF